MLAIVGGAGRLPDLIADEVDTALCFAPEGVVFGSGVREAEPFRPERLGDLLARLRERGADRVVFAGALRRPQLDPAAADAFTTERLPALADALRQGDDALLRHLVCLFENEGFAVVGADSVVPELLPSPGVLTSRSPTAAEARDAARGFSVIAALGAADVGQGCVVAAGQVISVETAPGTDWMLATLRGEVPGRTGAGVFCKAPKPEQDRRVDLPAIGPETVQRAADAGLAGIAIAAGGVLVLDRDEVRATAEARGLWVWVRPA